MPQKDGAPVRAPQKISVLRMLIGAIHETSRGTYGSPRIHSELRATGRPCGRNRVARLMLESGLRAKTKRRYRPLTTNSKHGYGIADNVLRRRFGIKKTGGINRAWCADITYVRTGAGWLYLEVLLDLGSRMVVGWAMRESLEADVSVEALRVAPGSSPFLRSFQVLLVDRLIQQKQNHAEREICLEGDSIRP